MECGIRLDCTEVFLRLLTIGLSNGAVIALNAIGVTLVYGVVRLINFAYGDLFALTTVFVAALVTGLGLVPESPPLLLAGGLALIFVGAVALSAGMNVVVERVAFRPFRNHSRIAPLIATIGISFMLYQGALLLRYVTNEYTAGEHRSVPGIPEVPRIRLPELLPRTDLVGLLGLPFDLAYPFKDLLVLVVAFILALLVGRFLQATRLGRALRACAQDPEMASLCGVNRNGTIRLAFAIGGGLSGAAAFVFALYYAQPFTSYGAQSGLIAFAAAVMGGIGRPRGAFVSGLLLGVLAAFSDYFLAAQWTPILILSILLALLVLRPVGLAGEQEEATTAGLAQRPRPHVFQRQQWLLLGLVGLLLAYPLLDAALGWRQQIVVSGMLVFVLLALGLNLVVGFAGLLDLGYAAAFGLGAFTTGLITMTGGRWAVLLPDFTLVLLVSAAVAGVFGALSGLLTRRLRGEYLAIATLALGQMLPQLILNFNRVTGGARGIAALPPPRLLGYSFDTPLARYYLLVGAVGLTAWATQRVVRSRVGRAWAAVSADEMAALSCGVSVTRHKTLALILGAAIAGMAGALFASTFSYVNEGQSEFRVTAMVLAMVVIGGAGSVPGAIIGALLVAGYDQLLIPLLGAWTERVAETTDFWLLGVLDVRALNFLSFGLALYLTVLLRMRGRRDWMTG